jgi:nicotinate-nucleotide adenylyltransferase
MGVGKRVAKTIGLLGGSFNPAHEGHLYISRYALKKLKLDEIWWLVSPQNPLKSSDEMAPFASRFASAKHMAKNRRIHVSDFEQKTGTRYSIDTIKALQKRYPRVQFVWLMGADNLAQFHHWRRWREIFSRLPVVVFDRTPFSHSAMRSPAALYALKKQLFSEVLLKVIRLRRQAVSSSQIRKKLAKPGAFKA